MQRLSVLPLPVALHGPLGYCTADQEAAKLFQAAGLGVQTRLTQELLGQPAAAADDDQSEGEPLRAGSAWLCQSSAAVLQACSQSR